MRLTNDGAILLGIFIGFTIFAIHSTIKFVKQRMLCSKAEKNGDVIVEGSVQRETTPIIITVALVVFLLCFMWTRRAPLSRSSLLSLSFVFYIIDNILIIIRLVMNILYGDTCYLTDHGLMCFEMNLEWSDCRFAWEAPVRQGEVTNILYIYKQEAKVPVIVRFNYKYDEAHKVIERYAWGMRYDGYMEVEDSKQKPDTQRMMDNMQRNS